MRLSRGSVVLSGSILRAGLAATQGASGHPDGVNCDGCHCHTNWKTGEHHPIAAGRAHTTDASKPTWPAGAACSMAVGSRKRATPRLLPLSVTLVVVACAFTSVPPVGCPEVDLGAEEDERRLWLVTREAEQMILTTANVSETGRVSNG